MNKWCCGMPEPEKPRKPQKLPEYKSPMYRPQYLRDLEAALEAQRRIKEEFEPKGGFWGFLKPMPYRSRGAAAVGDVQARESRLFSELLMKGVGRPRDSSEEALREYRARVREAVLKAAALSFVHLIEDERVAQRKAAVQNRRFAPNILAPGVKWEDWISAVARNKVRQGAQIPWFGKAARKKAFEARRSELTNRVVAFVSSYADGLMETEWDAGLERAMQPRTRVRVKRRGGGHRWRDATPEERIVKPLTTEQLEERAKRIVWTALNEARGEAFRAVFSEKFAGMALQKRKQREAVRKFLRQLSKGN